MLTLSVPVPATKIVPLIAGPLVVEVTTPFVKLLTLMTPAEIESVPSACGDVLFAFGGISGEPHRIDGGIDGSIGETRNAGFGQCAACRLAVAHRPGRNPAARSVVPVNVNRWIVTLE